MNLKETITQNQLGLWDKTFTKSVASKIAHQKAQKGSSRKKHLILDILRHDPLTADEIAERLDLTPFSIRPRVCELFKEGLIEDAGMLRKNAAGGMATVWRIKAKEPLAA